MKGHGVVYVHCCSLQWGPNVTCYKIVGVAGPRGWWNVDPEPRVGGGVVQPKAEKKKVTPTILIAQLTTSAMEMVSDATSD